MSQSAMVILFMVLLFTEHGADAARIKTSRNNSARVRTNVNDAVSSQRFGKKPLQQPELDEATSALHAAAGEIYESKLAETEQVAPSLPIALQAEDRSVRQWEELQDAVKMCGDMTDRAKLENNGVVAFMKFRRACLHISQGGNMDILDQAATHATPVFSFLISFTHQHRNRAKQLAEILSIVMDSEPWVSTFKDTEVLQELIRELKEDVKSYIRPLNIPEFAELLGAPPMQQEPVLEDVDEELSPTHVNESSPRHAEEVIEGSPSHAGGSPSRAEEQVAEDSFLPVQIDSDEPEADPIKEGERVAAEMELLKNSRDSLQDEKKRKAGRKVSWRDAPEHDKDGKRQQLDSIQFFDVPAEPDEWVEYTAPGGRKYYYNKRSKQSVWELPEGAVVDKPRESDAARNGERRRNEAPHEGREAAAQQHAARQQGVKFTPSEEQMYQHFWDADRYWERNSQGTPDRSYNGIADFLKRSGLQRHIVLGIWQVITSKTGDARRLGPEEFKMMCRLVGHGQHWKALNKELNYSNWLLFLAEAVPNPPPPNRMPAFYKASWYRA